MFDPTIYDNLKVVLEGCVYDLDLDGKILVTNRSDRVELASMARSCSIRFREIDGGAAAAELGLHTELADLAAELLEQEHIVPGCVLTVRFETFTTDPQHDCPTVEKALLDIWEDRPDVVQTVSYQWPRSTAASQLHISLDFRRKVDESHAADFPKLVQAAAHSLRWLNDYASSRGGTGL
ncbi:hypothetical protein ACFFK0_19910 [Paenibacillus chartarius]|uniref:Uncharacterized protein n=1 Tax=Paenibacillus chartarius TaxID=747481 RepID=A0ABV6DPV5_9BACL